MTRFIFLFSVFTSLSVCADPSITSYGLFSESGEHLETTGKVKIGSPVVFGFCFSMYADTTESRLTFVETIKHPLLIKSNGIESIGYSVPKKYTVSNSKVTGCVMYKAAKTADLVPGLWELSISRGQSDLVAQKFIVE